MALAGCTTSGTPMAGPLTTTSTTTVTSTPADDYDDSYDDDSLDIETSYLPEPTTTTPKPTIPPARRTPRR
ncbi:hypothetical protein GII30_18855 [Gordonia amarae]|uniref:Uncharacterized protein n=1 Tax=Gordonia amarae TaxID=36821 RepID=A0A857LRN2_9ACTN|nr:hypothetical protein [Gordonia amarae]MCS3880497.1 hypothetical protein [Gordonia amarae]QHN18826.1 hypothetical protein GII35_19215 [Gordonia amarae]QHN23301.1 hypothetical protein GII34_18715 [Gordonia amarae]QHN32202.1 hypothetical protein GII32_19025 [Gordonia amarae]QHN40949.1 hypothetical protein GII30_18855 [Gordonia amarae]